MVSLPSGRGGLLSLCPGGDTVKLLGHPKASPTTLQPERACGGTRDNDPGHSDNGEDELPWTSLQGGNEMGNQQPSPYRGQLTDRGLGRGFSLAQALVLGCLPGCSSQAKRQWVPDQEWEGPGVR
jgi:hypothetical protein